MATVSEQHQAPAELFYYTNLGILIGFSTQNRVKPQAEQSCIETLIQIQQQQQQQQHFTQARKHLTVLTSHSHNSHRRLS
ncbi:hypothetical protein Scep_010002 [Stephania cephalantha]|uniref:Uncharacterized protein n=1 Tax=Stephania cephalantha TaxID=152367 RepID=A0AAP0PGT3_9MAGN